MDTSTLLILITGVIILIVIVPITVQLIEYGKLGAEKQTCSTAVNFAAFKVGPTDYRPIADENKIAQSCPHNAIKISKNTERPIILNEVQKQISTCWNKFGRGKTNFLSPLETGEYEHFCFECASISSEVLLQKSISPEEIIDLVDQKYKDKSWLNLAVRQAEEYTFAYPMKIYFIASKNREKENLIFNDNEYLFYPIIDKRPLFQNLGINYFVYITMEEPNKQRNKYCFGFPDDETKFIDTKEKEIRI